MKGRQRGLGVSPSRTTAVDLGGSSGPHPFEKRYIQGVEKEEKEIQSAEPESENRALNVLGCVES